jgi:hypothetical protein
VKRCFFAACVAMIGSSFVFSQSPAEKDLFEKLTKGKDQAKALETVLKAPEGYSPSILFFGASVALNEKRLEDSAFLFYAGQLRTRFEKECFPPKGTGGNSPFVAYAAVSREIGSKVNPAVMADPKAFAKAIDRLKKFQPKAAKEYDPGYEITERKSEQDAHAATKTGREEFIGRMSDLSTLLNDAEYFAAFRVIQAVNLGTEEKGPTKDDYKKAVETMKRIEKDKKLKGFFSD